MNYNNKVEFEVIIGAFHQHSSGSGRLLGTDDLFSQGDTQSPGLSNFNLLASTTDDGCDMNALDLQEFETENINLISRLVGCKELIKL